MAVKQHTKQMKDQGTNTNLMLVGEEKHDGQHRGMKHVGRCPSKIQNSTSVVKWATQLPCVMQMLLIGTRGYP